MKVRIIINILTLFTFALFVSCESAKNFTYITPLNTNNNLVTIDIDKAIQQDTIASSLFLKEPKVVVLETKSDCYIQQIDNLEVYDNKIYVFDAKSNKLFVFNINGKYLYNIGHIGNGPGEYIELSDFTIDRDHHHIYLLDTAKHIILVFDSNTGKFLSKIKNEKENINDVCNCIQYAYNKLYINRKTKDVEDSNYMLKEINLSTGETENKYLDANTHDKGWNYPLLINCFSDKGGKYPKFSEMFSDTIVSITDKGLIPSYYVKSKDMITTEDVKELLEDEDANYMDYMKKDKISIIRNFVEMKNYVLFEYNKGMEYSYCCLYNRTSGQSTVAYCINNDYLSKKGGVNVHMYYSDSKICVTGIAPICIPIFVKMIKEGLLDPDDDNYEGLLNLNDNSNPVLFIQEYK